LLKKFELGTAPNDEWRALVDGLGFDFEDALFTV
jgi:hypothetical protein